MAIAYILYSQKLKKYYIGASTLSITERLANHNDKHYKNKYTAKGIPWVLFWYIGVEDIKLAAKIERHIKT